MTSLCARCLLTSFLLVLAAAVPFAAQRPPQSKTESEIVTYGSGEVTLSPQRAVLRIGVATHAPRASDASSQNAQAMKAVVEALARVGVPRDSLQTVAFGVGPNYDYDSGQRLIDYEAHAAVRLTVRDLSIIGRLIDVALEAGATDVGNVGFESDSMEIARRKALAQALGKARGDAEALAQAAGGSLGQPLEVKARDAHFPDYEAFASSGYMLRQSQTPITPRDVVVRVAVEARWHLVSVTR
jgi:uncharacterized protein